MTVLFIMQWSLNLVLFQVVRDPAPICDGILLTFVWFIGFIN